MAIITRLADGRYIARGTIPTQVVGAAGEVSFTVSFPELRRVEYLLSINFGTDPGANVSVSKTPATQANVVGITAYVSAGTTLSGEVYVVGY